MDDILGKRGLCNSYGRFVFGRDFLDTHEIIEILFDVLKKGFLNAWRFKYRKESSNLLQIFLYVAFLLYAFHFFANWKVIDWFVSYNKKSPVPQFMGYLPIYINMVKSTIPQINLPPLFPSRLPPYPQLVPYLHTYLPT